MGTRHLTMIYANGAYRVSQYGQWDGYPDGQGLTILTSLRGLDLSTLRERALAVIPLTKEEKGALEIAREMMRWPTRKQAD